MSKQFRSCNLNQAYLLPPSLDDWLPEGHLARFVAEVVEALDLSENRHSSPLGDIATYDGDFEHVANLVEWKPMDVVQ